MGSCVLVSSSEALQRFDYQKVAGDAQLITSSVLRAQLASALARAMSTCLNPEPAPELSSLLWIAAGVGGTCLVLQAALTLLFAKLLPAGPWTSQPAFAACAQP